MMRPRLDPDTRPVTLPVQIVRRARTDQYGAERGRRWLGRYRPMATRNGVPEARYRYQGTGQSMSEDEATAYLTTRKRGPDGT